MMTAFGAMRPLVSLLLVCSVATPAAAGIGKRISTAVIPPTPIVAASPTVTTTSLNLPSSYKSKANYLKVTISSQMTCSGGDALSLNVDVGAIDMLGGPETVYSSPDTSIMTRSYYLDAEAHGGPAVTPGSTVDVSFSSDLGTGCSVYNGQIVVEAAK